METATINVTQLRTQAMVIMSKAIARHYDKGNWWYNYRLQRRMQRNLVWLRVSEGKKGEYPNYPIRYGLRLNGDCDYLLSECPMRLFSLEEVFSKIRKMDYSIPEVIQTLYSEPSPSYRT